MTRMPDNGCRRQQRYPLVVLLLALSFLSPLSAHAKVFKCVAENGEIMFSQTPCPKADKKDKESVEESETTTPTPRPGLDKGGQRDGVIEKPAKTAYATQAPQLALLQDQDNQQAENDAQRAQKFQADTRDEEQRLQCETNVKAQINSINAQIKSGKAPSIVDFLTKKRQALESRLSDC